MTTIAVIDDDQPLLDLMAELLAERDWILLPIRDSSSAFESVRTVQPDAVLLDIRLGSGPSGWDILDELRTDPETFSTPVVVWSGDARLLETRQQWLRELGITALAKPFEIDDLYRILDDVLRDRSRVYDAEPTE